MAAIADEAKSIDLKALYRDMQKALPAYARPVFLRFMEEVEYTGM